MFVSFVPDIRRGVVGLGRRQRRLLGRSLHPATREDQSHEITRF
jgi:hypothetical protein